MQSQNVGETGSFAVQCPAGPVLIDNLKSGFRDNSNGFCKFSRHDILLS